MPPQHSTPPLRHQQPLSPCGGGVVGIEGRKRAKSALLGSELHLWVEGGWNERVSRENKAAQRAPNTRPHQAGCTNPLHNHPPSPPPACIHSHTHDHPSSHPPPPSRTHTLPTPQSPNPTTHLHPPTQGHRHTQRHRCWGKGKSALGLPGNGCGRRRRGGPHSNEGVGERVEGEEASEVGGGVGGAEEDEARALEEEVGGDSCCVWGRGGGT